MKKKISWKELTTRNGYPADEVISALQKEIRRNNQDKAVYWAYELCISGKVFETKFWERIITISVEDIGFGNPLAVVIVNSLKNSYYSEFEHQDDSLIQALFAAAYLASCTKDRYIDEYKNYLKESKIKLEVPDYALDKHTKRGKTLGRDDKHFWTVAAKLSPELAKRNKKYLKLVLKSLK